MDCPPSVPLLSPPDVIELGIIAPGLGNISYLQDKIEDIDKSSIMGKRPKYDI
jgi:hypothetical protein